MKRPKRTPVLATKKSSKTTAKTKVTKKTKKKKKAPPKKIVDAKKTHNRKAPPQRVRNKPKSSKRKSKTRKVTVKVDVEVPEGDEQSLGYIRWMGGQYYTTNLNQCSIDDMLQHPMFGTLSRVTLGKWCTQDKWVLRRKEFQEKVRSRVEHAIANEIVRKQSAQLATLQDLFDKVLAKIMDSIDSLVVNSGNIPSLIGKMTQLADLMHKWRISLGEQLIPQINLEDESSPAGHLPLKPKLTEEEARAAAKLMIKMRREAIERKALEVEQAKADPVGQALQVVDGGR